MLLLLIRALFILACGLRSSKRIHNRAISTLLKAPVLEFEAGKEDAIFKAFSKDMECLDEKLPPDILLFFQLVVEHAAVVAIIKFTAPWSILAAIPAFLIALFIGRHYLRLESHARALERRSLKPLLTHFSDVIEGAVTIRACQKEKYFTKEFFRLVLTRRFYQPFLSDCVFVKSSCDIKMQGKALSLQTNLKNMVKNFVIHFNPRLRWQLSSSFLF